MGAFIQHRARQRTALLKPFYILRLIALSFQRTRLSRFHEGKTISILKWYLDIHSFLCAATTEKEIIPTNRKDIKVLRVEDSPTTITAPPAAGSSTAIPASITPVPFINTTAPTPTVPYPTTLNNSPVRRPTAHTNNQQQPTHQLLSTAATTSSSYNSVEQHHSATARIRLLPQARIDSNSTRTAIASDLQQLASKGVLRRFATEDTTVFLRGLQSRMRLLDGYLLSPMKYNPFFGLPNFVLRPKMVAPSQGAK